MCQFFIHSEGDAAHLRFTFHADAVACRVGEDIERGFLRNLLHSGFGVHVECDRLGGEFHNGIAEVPFCYFVSCFLFHICKSFFPMQILQGV